MKTDMASKDAGGSERAEEPQFTQAHADKLVDGALLSHQVWLQMKEAKAHREDLSHWVDQQLRLDESQRLMMRDLRAVLREDSDILSETDRTSIVNRICDLASKPRTLESIGPSSVQRIIDITAD